MSESVYAGLTSQTIDVFLGDSSSTTGGGLTGLVYNSSGLSCYYRKGATGSATSVSLADISGGAGGTWVSGGLIEVDSTNMPGVYRFDIPNVVVNSEGFVTVYFSGATNLVPTAIRIDCRPIPSDLKKIQTDAQSVTDLKDFADAGYDPATNYITGIAGTKNTLDDLNDVSTAQVNAEVDTALGDYDGPTNTEMVAAFTEIKGATWSTTDTLEEIRDNLGAGGGDATEAKQDTIIAAIGALNDLSAADVNTQVDTALSDIGLDHLVSATGAAASNGGTTSFISNLSSAVDDFYTDHELVFISGSLAGQSRVISNYTGSSKTIQFDEPLTTSVTSGDEFVIWGLHGHTKTQLAYAIWQSATTIASGLTGTFGYQLSTVLNAVLTDTDELQSNQGDWATATGFSTHSAADVRTEMDSNSTQLAAIVTDTGTTLPAQITAAFTEIKGATWSTTDTLEEIRDNLGGGGGDATEAKQDTIIAALAVVDGIVDSILEDTGTTIPATLSTILADTNELQTNQGDWATADVSGLATAAALATVDANVDSILVDTGTSIPATLTTILADTSELQTNQGNWVTADVSGLATAAALATVDTNVDAILVDTGTTIPAQITALNNLSAQQVWEYGLGGSSRTPEEALAFLRNKWVISGGTLTVYTYDDTTALWSAATTQTAGDPTSAVDPA